MSVDRDSAKASTVIFDSPGRWEAAAAWGHAFPAITDGTSILIIWGASLRVRNS
jgi:hypothetical protein